MKIFISFRFTGEDPNVLRTNIDLICSALGSAGHEIYCSIFNENMFRKKNFTNAKILEYSLFELDKSEAVLAFVSSGEKSEGMLLELGYAFAKRKPIYLLIKEGVSTTFLAEIAKKTLTFKKVEEFPKLLREL